MVLSLDGAPALETFSGELAGGGQNFPRFYLLLIRGVRALLGPETWATRLLPFLSFLAATFLWMRLLVVRFGARPEADRLSTPGVVPDAHPGQRL